MDYSEIIEQIKPSIGIVVRLANINGKIMITSKGSGFVFSKKGLLVTCNHVVTGKDSFVKIRFPDSKDFIDAEVVLRDEEHDLALLKFNDDTREPLNNFGGLVKEGIPVIFSGYPLGLDDLTTHQGILSAIIKDAANVVTYVIDGTVNPGNSGCPLMTKEGEVIGIVNATRRERLDLLKKVEEMQVGAISLYGTDLVEIYQAITQNLQLGIGYAVPAAYIPTHKDSITIEKIAPEEDKIKKSGKKQK